MMPLERFIKQNYIDEDSLSLVNKEVIGLYKVDEVGETYWVEFTTPCSGSRYKIFFYYEPHISYNYPIRVDITLVWTWDQLGHFTEPRERIHIYRMPEYTREFHKYLYTLLGYRLFPF